MADTNKDDLVARFMMATVQQFKRLDVDDRSAIYIRVTSYVDAGLQFANLPATADNIRDYMKAALSVQPKWGPNSVRDNIRSWSLFSDTPNQDEVVGVAMLMSLACFGITNNSDLSAKVRDIVLVKWTKDSTVWDIVCLIPFFVIP